MTTQTGFDSLNQATSVTDPLGKTTTTGYDQAGNRTSQVDPAGTAQSWTYDGNNQVIEARAAATEPPTISHYDAAGRLDSQTTPVGEQTTFAYDAAGHQVGVTSPRGNVPGADPARFTTRYGYDLAGNQVSVTDPLGDRTTTEFDADDNVIETTDPNGHSVRYRYDAANRLVRIVGPDARDDGQATVAAALRQRGVGEPQATLAAEAGMTVLRVSLQRWAGGDDDRDLAAIMQNSVAELRAVAAGG